MCSDVSGFSLLVAAHDARVDSKRLAPFICDGIADDVEINGALQALPGGAGRVLANKFGGKEWFAWLGFFWQSNFFPLRESLLTGCEYAELSRENRSVPSQEFASIVKDASSIFASLMDGLVRGAGIPADKLGRYYFHHFRDFLQKEDPDLHRRTVGLFLADPPTIVVPFESLERPTGVPEWWDAYTSLKHRGTTEFRKGNLGNSVGVVCALALLGKLMGVFIGDEFFKNVGLVYKQGSSDLSDKRRLFPPSSSP